MLLYGVDVHIFFPNTMYTDGYEAENKTKPSITKKIEEGDEGVTPDQAAASLFKGLQRGQVHITCDLITSLFSASTRGATPRNSWLLDALFDFVAYVCALLAYFCSAELMFAAACGTCLENVCGETGCSASGRTRAISGCKGILLDYSFHVVYCSLQKQSSSCCVTA